MTQIPNQNPEQKARDRIDQQLISAAWFECLGDQARKRKFESDSAYRKHLNWKP